MKTFIKGIRRCSGSSGSKLAKSSEAEETPAPGGRGRTTKEYQAESSGKHTDRLETDQMGGTLHAQTERQEDTDTQRESERSRAPGDLRG